MRRPLQQWLLSSHIFVLLLPLGALLVTGALSGDLRTQARISMLDQGSLVSLLVLDHLAGGPTLLPGEDLERLSQNAALAAHAEVCLLDHRGQRVAGPLPDRDVEDWAAVAAALDGNQGWQRHGSSLSVTNPILRGDDVVGVVIMTRAPRQPLDALLHMAPRLSAGLLAALLLTLTVSAGAGLTQARALRALAGTARRIADGDLTASEALNAPRSSAIEELHQLAEAFADMSTRLRSRLSYIHEFASNVSHEFKTPLSTLRGTLELLQDDDEMPAEQRARFLANAQSELQRMDRLVNGLLALARAEEQVGSTPVDLQALLEDVVARFPDVRLIGSAASVRADGRQLEAVVLNLLKNAEQHGASPIQVEAFARPNETGFSVTDAGPGISEKNLAQLFDRFFTTDRRQGTGLGLALARTICRVHGGDITAATAPGRTTFTVTLPRA